MNEDIDVKKNRYLKLCIKAADNDKMSIKEAEELQNLGRDIYGDSFFPNKEFPFEELTSDNVSITIEPRIKTKMLREEDKKKVTEFLFEMSRAFSWWISKNQIHQKELDSYTLFKEYFELFTKENPQHLEKILYYERR